MELTDQQRIAEITALCDEAQTRIAKVSGVDLTAPEISISIYNDIAPTCERNLRKLAGNANQYIPFLLSLLELQFPYCREAYTDKRTYSEMYLSLVEDAKKDLAIGKMDKREAIVRIKDHMEAHGIGKPPHVKVAKALNMAVAALRAEEEGRCVVLPCKVSRIEEAIQSLYENNGCLYNDIGLSNDYGDCRKGCFRCVCDGLRAEAEAEAACKPDGGGQDARKGVSGER